MMIRLLPLIVAIAPPSAVAAAYWLNIHADVLPSCMPFLDGCTSISATGRYMPGSMVFRAVLLPHAALLAVLWWFARAWLRDLRPGQSAANAIFLCGLVAALALIVYVTFLGTTQPFYEFMRRFGVYFYFLGTVLAQIALAFAMPSFGLRRVMRVVAAAPLLIGASNLVLKAILVDTDNIENSFEWIAALLMQLWFLLLFFAWRKSHMTVIVQATAPQRDSTSDYP